MEGGMRWRDKGRWGGKEREREEREREEGRKGGREREGEGRGIEREGGKLL